MTAGTFPTLRRRAEEARDRQLRLLHRLEMLDEACAHHMQHGAMSGGDPLTDSMYDQMAAAAEEGARPPTPYPAGITPPRESRAWWLAAITLLAALVSVALLLPARI